MKKQLTILSINFSQMNNFLIHSHISNEHKKERNTENAQDGPEHDYSKDIFSHERLINEL